MKVKKNTRKKPLVSYNCEQIMIKKTGPVSLHNVHKMMQQLSALFSVTNRAPFFPSSPENFPLIFQPVLDQL